MLLTCFGILSGLLVQSEASDPEGFPFVLLGNKVDVNGGKSRMVRKINFFGGIN